MVKLLHDQQELFVSLKPGTFVPAKGAWGLRGATSVKLRVAPKALVRQALVAAWRNTAPKSLVRQYEGASSGGPAGP